MSEPLRCLFSWEMGENYGHLVRCLSLAEQLRIMGHEVLFAVRDMRSAAELLASRRFSFIQSPRLIRPAVRATHAPVNYSEMLLAEGYRDALSLQGAVEGWLTLYRLIKPDVLIADHAPTAILAARIAGLPAAALGGGFEIPPDVSPLPSIRPWMEVAVESLARADSDLLVAMNTLLRRYRKPRLQFVSDLFAGTQQILATYPELDHYGPRPGGNYVGVFYKHNTRGQVAWPDGEGRRILVYLRPRVPGFGAVLDALRESPHRVIFVAPGMHPDNVRKLSTPRLQLFRALIDTEALLVNADAAIGYGGVGFSTQVLQAGVPQLVLSQYAEQQLMGLRLAALETGIAMGLERDRTACAEAIANLLGDKKLAEAARTFARRNRNYDAPEAVSAISKRIAELPKKFMVKSYVPY